jgi:hypothetical protein
MLFTVGILASAALFAPQQGEEGSAAIQKDAAFALALTKQLGFSSFSEIVIDDAMERASTADDRSSLLLARCQILETVAVRPGSPAEEVAAWRKAADAYIDFIGSGPSQAQGVTARLQLGFVGFQYGEKVYKMFESGALDAASRSSALEEAEKTFEESLKSINWTISWWRSLDDPDVQEGAKYTTFFPASFYRALTYHYWGMLYPANSVEREDNIARALEFLEDFAITAGENTRAGLLAYKHMGDGYVGLGDPDSFGIADELYLFVIEEGVPDGADGVMAPGEIRGRRSAQQDAWLGRMLMFKAAGRQGDVPALGATFQQWVADNRVELNDSGYRVLMAVAKQMIDDGNFGDAITLLQSIADANDGKLLRLEADALLGEAIAAAPAGAPINLDVLFQAGQGAYYSKNFGEAAKNLRLLISRLDGSSQSQAIGGKAFYFLGRALEDDELVLEAAVAFSKGYEAYSDDEDNAEKLAQRWHKLAERFRNADPTDKYLDNFYNNALDALKEASGGGAPHVVMLRSADTDYQLAKSASREARGKPASSPEAKAAMAAFDKAILSYKRVDKGTESYEKGYVSIGLCEFNKFAWDPMAMERAIEVFENYLNVYTKDQNFLPNTPKGKRNRKDSSATADFYLGRSYRNLASAGDLSKWESMLSHLEGFEERHPDQADQIGATKTYRTEAFLALSRDDDAMAEYESLVAAGARSNWLNACSFKLYVHFKAKAEAETDLEAKLPSTRLAVKYLQVANSQDTRPKWQNLLTEARLYLEIGDVATGTKVLENTLQRFGPADGLGGTSRFFAEVDLIQAYLEQGNTGTAVPLMDKLLKERPKNLRVKSMAIAIKTGFPVVREGRVMQVAGEDTVEAYKTAEKLIGELLQLAEATALKEDKSKFETKEWWQAKLQHVYLLYKWGSKDSTKDHQKLLRSLEQLAPDFGEDVTGPEIKRLFMWLKNQS